MNCLLWLLTALAVAAPAKNTNSAPLWALSFPGAQPTAAYFDVASSALYVSLRDQNGAGGRIARVSLEGKLEEDKLARSKGPPGALRSYDGRVYWIAGNSVQSFGAADGLLPEGTIPLELGEPVDIALARGPIVYVGLASGNLVRLRREEPPSVALKSKAPITGLTLLQDTLYILRGRRLESFPVSGHSAPKESGLDLCATPCHALERTSAGDWLTVNESRVLAGKGKGHEKTLFTAPAGTALGRPAYVYRMEPKDDFFVLPFPESGEIRAYRVAGATKP